MVVTPLLNISVISWPVSLYPTFKIFQLYWRQFMVVTPLLIIFQLYGGQFMVELLIIFQLYPGGQLKWWLPHF